MQRKLLCQFWYNLNPIYFKLELERLAVEMMKITTPGVWHVSDTIGKLWPKARYTKSCTIIFKTAFRILYMKEVSQYNKSHPNAKQFRSKIDKFIQTPTHVIALCCVCTMLIFSIPVLQLPSRYNHRWRILAPPRKWWIINFSSGFSIFMVGFSNCDHRQASFFLFLSLCT